MATCSWCGASNPAEARVCSSCGKALEGPSILSPSPNEAPRIPLARFGLILLVAAVVALGVLALLFVDFDDDGIDLGDEPKSGTLVVSLVNPFSMSSNPLHYELYLNGQLASNGTIPVAGSVVVEKDFNWTGQEFVVLIHVAVDVSSPPSDMTATLTPGETERVTIVISS